MESKIEERFDYKGYPCVVMFQPMGFRTGYVGVPKDSILYGRNSTVLNTILECHGGVTYTESRLYGQEDENTWWVGFDCGHAWDGYDADTTWKYFRKDLGDYKRLYDGEIRTKEYVENECRSLVEQIQNSNNLTELDIVIKVSENSYADMSDVAVKYLKEYRSKLEREKTKSNINTGIWCGRRGIDPCYFEDKMSEARCGKCYYAHGYEWKPKGIKEVIGFVEGRFPIEREDVLYWLYYAKERKWDRDMEEAQAYGYK